MSVKVRFAPSPTGRLHVGNARVALVNWLFARQRDGRLALRLDDTDRERSTEAFARGIEEDLRWLGLGWDDHLRQSNRLSRYAEAAERLKAAGRLYPCYETEEELKLARAAQRRQGRPPRYDRRGLKLTAGERARLEAAGRRPHWRFLLPDEEASWADLVQGEKRIPGGDMSDPVLLRSDGQPLYTLTSVVDDIELQISHVIRGADHVANTGVQIALFRALGAEPPVFAHLPLLVDAQGQGLSKRLASLSLEGLRKQGIYPTAINSYLARLGTGDPQEPVRDLAELLHKFDISRYSRSPAKFNILELRSVNDRTIKKLDWPEILPVLREIGLRRATEEFWRALRDEFNWSLQNVQEIEGWYLVCYERLEPINRGDPEFTRLAAELLPAEPWDESALNQWIALLRERSGRKGKELFTPLRLALTHRTDGPDLRKLLPLIGRARAVARLLGEAA